MQRFLGFPQVRLVSSEVIQIVFRSCRNVLLYYVLKEEVTRQNVCILPWNLSLKQNCICILPNANRWCFRSCTFPNFVKSNQCSDFSDFFVFISHFICIFQWKSEMNLQAVERPVNFTIEVHGNYGNFIGSSEKRITCISRLCSRTSSKYSRTYY